MGAEVFIPLTQGKVTVIDFEDFDERIRNYKWYAIRSKTGHTFYATRYSKLSEEPDRIRKRLMIHRLVMNAPPHLDVDHRNGDGLDNRKDNLRLVNDVGNGRAFRTKAKGKLSRFRGVSWHILNNKWIAAIRSENRTIHIGYFKDQEEASRAWDKKAREMGFFEEAMNFPQ